METEKKLVPNKQDILLTNFSNCKMMIIPVSCTLNKLNVSQYCYQTPYIITDNIDRSCVEINSVQPESLYTLFDFRCSNATKLEVNIVSGNVLNLVRFHLVK